MLPEPTDEWVEENIAEFDSVDAWRSATRERLQAMKLNDVRQQLVGKVTEALTGLTDIEPPESLVQSDLRRRVEATVRQLQSQGISMDQWLSVTGQDEASFITAMKGASEQAVKVDLALRAVAAAEAIEADDGDLGAEYDAAGDAVRAEGQPDPQGLRAQRPGARADCPDPQAEGARLAAPPRRARRPRRPGARPRPRPRALPRRRRPRRRRPRRSRHDHRTLRDRTQVLT